MTILVDTSILARLANSADALYPVADHAVPELVMRGHRLYLAPQNLVEFRNAATRPAGVNGLGKTAAEADALVDGFEAKFGLLDESPAVHARWKRIVRLLGVIGKQVHDARLVAMCHEHGLAAILTFNLSHFRTLSAAPPGIVVLDPATV